MSEQDSIPEMPPEVAALHPFVLQVCSVLVPGTDGERYWINEDDVHQIHAGLLDYEGDDELLHILHGLGAMATVMRDQLNSPSLSDQIMAILESEELQKAFLKVKISSDPEALAAAARSFTNFADKDGNKKAPMANEPRPEGTVTLDGLKFPRRL